ncbi:hypothetical protein LTR56_005216 [Elasticomyces elasticus]|nr:hypothetical protein LTR56_005216 [Elasticomyces elasticus]KAK3659672.1 hypothetical protein LTR22_008403 [Elasticomyces elasticus]KAK4916895.1 hypothetical protein LTR49_015207 [Elasticomyces elasticus]KAK5747599.1 hypothetical protein LTS12_022336 [Elasticomyces elasticus]
MPFLLKVSKYCEALQEHATAHSYTPYNQSSVYTSVTSLLAPNYSDLNSTAQVMREMHSKGIKLGLDTFSESSLLWVYGRELVGFSDQSITFASEFPGDKEAAISYASSE